MGFIKFCKPYMYNSHIYLIKLAKLRETGHNKVLTIFSLIRLKIDTKWCHIPIFFVVENCQNPIKKSYEANIHEVWSRKSSRIFDTFNTIYLIRKISNC